jgi:hypothetical protein
MSYDAKRWYITRCICTKPILYQDLDRYPLRCARCGGHLYTEPRPFQFMGVRRKPRWSRLATVLRWMGLVALGLLGYIAMCILFVVLGGL